MGGPWPMKAAMESRPSAVSLKAWLRKTTRHGQIAVDDFLKSSSQIESINCDSPRLVLIVF